MSQQYPPPPPKRPVQQGQSDPYQRPPQQGQGYPPPQGHIPPQRQGYPSQAQPSYPPQAQPSYPPPPPPVQVLEVRHKSNWFLNFLKMLAFPFVKFFGFIAHLISIVIQEMLRSVVRFIMGLILLGIFLTLIGIYGFALMDSNFDFLQAMSLSLERIMAFFGMGG